MSTEGEMTEARKAQMRAFVAHIERVLPIWEAEDYLGSVRLVLRQLADFVPDALAHIERLEEAARDHDCPSFAMCTRHATKEGANPQVCVYCEIERWKARVENLTKAYDAEFVRAEGLDAERYRLRADVKALDQQVAQHVEAYKSAHDRAQVAEAERDALGTLCRHAEGEVARLTEDYWKVNQSWAESRERHLTAEAALATLRASIHAKLNEDQWQCLRSIAVLVGWTGLPRHGGQMTRFYVAECPFCGAARAAVWRDGNRDADKSAERWRDQGMVVRERDSVVWAKHTPDCWHTPPQEAK
jgi:hypothetical protein